MLDLPRPWNLPALIARTTHHATRTTHVQPPVDARTKPPSPLRAGALALRFLLELTALGALAVWGFRMDASVALRILTAN